jgi:DNA-directed RNA polymerase specialized sigma24 family protein
MKNHVKDHFKRNEDVPFAQFSAYSSEDNDTSREDSLENQQNVLLEVNRDYTFEQIQEAMHNLEESFRHIIHLKYIEEYSYEEIANTT